MFTMNREKLIEINKSEIFSEIDTFTMERYKQFSKYIFNKQTVLDVGCNTGRGGKILRENFPESKIYGIDLVSDWLSCIPDGIYDQLFNDSIISWEGNNLKYDRIVAGEVIEHIPKEEFQRLLQNCRRMLDKDGLILVTTPNPDSYWVKIGRKAVFNDPSHVNIMSIKEFKLQVKNAGLSILKISGSGKMTRYLKKFPLLNLYGSYIAILKS